MKYWWLVDLCFWEWFGISKVRRSDFPLNFQSGDFNRLPRFDLWLETYMAYFEI